MSAGIAGLTFIPRMAPAGNRTEFNKQGDLEGFIAEDFLLQSKMAENLYHNYAERLPIIDYHNHLPPQDIAENRQFDTITQIWLDGDHYKWRAMRANGIDEKYITGDATDFEKFQKWAQTVPYTLMNPLYHWTHLELKRYFGINKLLNSKTAKEIYDEANRLLQTENYRVQNLLKSKNVEVVCTTDDPVDDLKYHRKLQEQNALLVLPAWRPDKAMKVESEGTYNDYLDKLSKAAKIAIDEYRDLIRALKSRQAYFNSMGCKVSDHGMETFYAEEFSEKEVNRIFRKIRSGRNLQTIEINKLKSSLLLDLGAMNHDFGWTQQFHIGPIRNNNTRMLELIGSDTGYDSIGDFEIAKPMAKFLNSLEKRKKLTKTIVYNVNPRDNELMASMVMNFNDGSIPGKMQYGSAWWFLDQKDGIEKQLKALGNMGLLGRFVGMTTDSRSFLSYSRHEYFRRVLCNMLGVGVEKGELPNDLELLGGMVEDICYTNARDYFGFK
ncbi:MAG: glucuronate isomerase [Cyclobacteriaceae bacterium]